MAGCADKSVHFHAELDPETLDEWGLFTRAGNELRITEGVITYDLNSALFSDYAHKLRTIHLPVGSIAAVEDDRLEYPVGTIISKTFFYPETGHRTLEATEDRGQYIDNRIGRAGGLDLTRVRLIETRLLVRRQSGWVGLPYVWDEGETSANLEITGDIKLLNLAASGDFNYIIPDQNQCAGCHAVEHTGGAMEPIGPHPHHLNRDYAYRDGTRNQLADWHARGLIDRVPEVVIPTPDWRDESLSITERARGYLDINCGHCHSSTGPADTSGLYLNLAETNMLRLGRCKPPIAAGQGTGGYPFSIVPGNAETSIMTYRMASTDPGAMMPELGRSLVHTEGVELISEWINSLTGSCKL